ncbi:MAG: hypothetical protein ACEPOW_02530 [Bacteroidales bacterium]
MKLKKSLFFLFSFTLLMSCSKKDLEKECKKGYFPRYENVIYQAHFNTNVFLDPISLGNDTLLLLQAIYNPDSAIYRYPIRAIVTQKTGKKIVLFNQGEKYIMFTRSEEKNYNYYYENLCK